MWNNHRTGIPVTILLMALFILPPAAFATPVLKGTVVLVADSVAVRDIPCPVVATDSSGRVVTGLAVIDSTGRVLVSMDRRWTDRDSYSTDITARTDGVSASSLDPWDIRVLALGRLDEYPRLPKDREGFMEYLADPLERFSARLDDAGESGPVQAYVLPKGTVLSIVAR